MIQALRAVWAEASGPLQPSDLCQCLIKAFILINKATNWLKPNNVSMTRWGKSGFLGHATVMPKLFCHNQNQEAVHTSSGLRRILTQTWKIQFWIAKRGSLLKSHIGEGWISLWSLWGLGPSKQCHHWNPTRIFSTEDKGNAKLSFFWWVKW